MLRWLATLAIGALFALNVALPSTSIGRRGTEAKARFESATASEFVGQPLPQLDLRNLDGLPIAWEDLAGHRVLLTFERSVDW